MPPNKHFTSSANRKGRPDHAGQKDPQDHPSAGASVFTEEETEARDDQGGLAVFCVRISRDGKAVGANKLLVHLSSLFQENLASIELETKCISMETASRAHERGREVYFPRLVSTAHVYTQDGVRRPLERSFWI